MRIDIATLFVDMCEAVLSESIIGRARRAGKIEIYCHNIRDYSKDKHRRVDDTSYGGGMGMVLEPQPIYDLFMDVCQKAGARPHCVYMSPQGKVFDQQTAKRFAALPNLFLLCGHYEGIDERIIEEIVDEEISIGDFVLTGGELPALMVADAVARLCDGVLSGEECFVNESHYDVLLEYPHYTRPPVWRDREVPEVLLSGNHANIEKWRRLKSVERTAQKRPDLIEKASLSPEERALADEIIQKSK